MEGVTTNLKSIELQSSLYPNMKVLKIFGLWPPEVQPLHKIYIIYGFITNNFITTLLILSEVISIILSWGNLELMIQASFLVLTHLAQAFKEVIYILHFTQIKELIYKLDRSIFKPRNNQQYQILFNIIKKSKVIHLVFVLVCFFTCILWSVDAIIKNNIKEQRILPISGWFPFNWEPSPIYEMVFCFQILSTMMNASIVCSLDTIVSGLLYHLGGQLDNLNDNLLNIKELAIDNLKKKGNWKYEKSGNEYELVDDQLQMEMDRLLVHCVNHHRTILEMAMDIGHLFSSSLLCQFAASSLIICLTMFELSMVEMFSLPFMGMLFYQNCMLIQIVIYCWFGNEVILKSSKLSESAYCSDWINCSMEYKRKLLFMMIRFQVPIKIYAGNFFSLSIDTLTTILRTSWSYFAVLYQVNQE